jgi:hypothetical protein
MASSYEIEKRDKLVLHVRRMADGRTASITMTGTTEAYILNIDDVYIASRTAYEDDSKWEILDDFFACVVAFAESDYYEEIGKRRGRIVSRVIHLNIPGGSYDISASVNWRSFIGRVLGYDTSIVRPDGAR